MKRTLLTITIAYLVFLSCAFYKAQIPGYFYDDGYYKNSAAGFTELGNVFFRGMREFRVGPAQLFEI